MDDLNIGATDALIIIDPQNDFCEGGALAVQGGDSIMLDISALAADFKDAGATVVLTQDYHPQGHKSFASTWYMDAFSKMNMPYGEQTLWPDHCVQKSPGAAFHPVIISGALNEADIIIRKGTNPEIDSYSAFVENDGKTKTGLASYLREKGVKRCIFVGLAYDYCVGFSALDARAAGFDAIVVRDLTRAIADTSALEMDHRLSEAGATETVVDNINQNAIA